MLFIPGQRIGSGPRQRDQTLFRNSEELQETGEASEGYGTTTGGRSEEPAALQGSNRPPQQEDQVHQDQPERSGKMDPSSCPALSGSLLKAVRNRFFSLTPKSVTTLKLIRIIK